MASCACHASAVEAQAGAEPSSRQTSDPATTLDIAHLASPETGRKEKPRDHSGN